MSVVDFIDTLVFIMGNRSGHFFLPPSLYLPFYLQSRGLINRLTKNVHQSTLNGWILTLKLCCNFNKNIGRILSKSYMEI